MTRITKTVGCVILFALPFAAGGIGGLIAFARGLGRDEEPARLVTLACLGVVFSLVGFGLIFAALRGRKDAERDAALRLQHPDAPWLWNAQWASRRIPDQSRSQPVLLWVFAILWNGVMLPALILVPGELEKGNLAALTALLFPLVGIGILVMAIRASLRARRFHQSTLVLETLPAKIGGALRGRVEVPHAGLVEASVIVVRLTACERRRRGQSSDETVLWQSDEEFARGALERTATGVAIPITIPIPPDAPQTDTEGAVWTRWRLSIDAELPGIDYYAVFEVPVFRASASDRTALETNGEHERASESTRLVEPAAPQSYVSLQTVEGRELRFPPPRARSLAFASFVVTTLWIAAITLLFVSGATLVITVLLALFGLPLLVATLDVFLHSSSILLGRENVVLRQHFIGSREHVIPRDEITGVEVKIGTQTSGANAQLYYAVRVHARNRKTITAAKYIRHKREAEWVASQLRDGAAGTRH